MTGETMAVTAYFEPSDEVLETLDAQTLRAIVRSERRVMLRGFLRQAMTALMMGLLSEAMSWAIAIPRDLAQLFQGIVIGGFLIVAVNPMAARGWRAAARRLWRP